MRRAHRPSRPALTFALGMLLLPPLAAAQALPKANFQEALVGAMADRNLRNVTLQGEQLKMQEQPNVSPLGAYRGNLISVCEMLGSRNSVSNQAGQVMRFANGAVFASTGVNLKFAFTSQVVQAHQRERVEKTLTERLATLNGEYGDLRAEIRRQDNGSYQLIAQHNDGSRPSASAARSRLGATLGNARFMICDIHTAMELSDHDRWNSLRKTKLGQVDRGTFVTLYPLLREPGYEVNGDGTEGNWAFQLSKELTAQVENVGTEMKAWVSVKLPAVPDAAGLAAMHARLRALSASHGATRIESIDPNSNGVVWVALVFSYAPMTGDDFADTRKDLVNDKDLIDFQKRVRRAALDGG